MMYDSWGSGASFRGKMGRCRAIMNAGMQKHRRSKTLLRFLLRLEPGPLFGPLAGYLTNWLILKIGRMMDMAMKPTMPPMQTIISGSIMLVTALIVTLSSLL